MSEHKLMPSEIRFLLEALSADYKICNIRLREGEYQYELAKAIASFQLELYFPDVKDIIRKLYPEERTNDIQFIRKIQTILKKMERSNIIKIVPKKKPWELQRYALSSFKFQDIDKSLVILTTDQQMKQMQILLNSMINQQGAPITKPHYVKTKIFILILLTVMSYAMILWNLTQPIINPIIFIPAFSIAVASSLLLGKILSQG